MNVAQSVSARALHAIARWVLRREAAAIDVQGLEHLPRTGPVLIAARHYHHLLDGAMLLSRLPRPVHLVVALDWTRDARQRRTMERLCAAARWPVLLRPATLGERGGYRPEELTATLRRGLRDAATLLGEGRAIVVFPEGYPVVDPTPSPSTPRRAGGAVLLPFAAGYGTIARLAARRGAAPIPIVPLGFSYAREGRRWRIAMRLGAPLGEDAGAEALRAAVAALSD